MGFIAWPTDCDSLEDALSREGGEENETQRRKDAKTQGAWHRDIGDQHTFIKLLSSVRTVGQGQGLAINSGEVLVKDGIHRVANGL